LKVGETRRFRVVILLSLNRIGAPQVSVQMRYSTSDWPPCHSDDGAGCKPCTHSHQLIPPRRVRGVMFPRFIARRRPSAIPALPGAIVPRPHFWFARSSTTISRARR
jgi:hypothetical protein